MSRSPPIQPFREIMRSVVNKENKKCQQALLLCALKVSFRKQWKCASWFKLETDFRIHLSSWMRHMRSFDVDRFVMWHFEVWVWKVVGWWCWGDIQFDCFVASQLLWSRQPIEKLDMPLSSFSSFSEPQSMLGLPQCSAVINPSISQIYLQRSITQLYPCSLLRENMVWLGVGKELQTFDSVGFHSYFLFLLFGFLHIHSSPSRAERAFKLNFYYELFLMFQHYMNLLRHHVSGARAESVRTETAKLFWH